VLLAAGAGSELLLAWPLGIILAVICGLLAAAAAALLLWLSQTLRLHEKGVSITSGLWRGEHSILWDEVELVEHTPRERLLRLRGRRSLICVGPGLLTPTQAVLLRGFLQEFCVNRDKPLVRRSRIF
jgi:hypothetical protein